MRYQSPRYDHTCPGCQGCGAIPCGACDGIGGIQDEHTGSGSMDTAGAWSVGQRTKRSTGRHACSVCQGAGALRCELCHGKGTRGPVAASRFA
jgi:hypothetical protein